MTQPLIPFGRREENLRLAEKLNVETFKTESLKSARSEVDSLSWTASGDRFMTCSRDGSVRVFNSDRLSEERIVSGSWTAAHGHPLDPNIIAMVSWDGKMRLTDLRTGKAAIEKDLREHKSELDKILALSWSTSGEALAIHTRADFVQKIDSGNLESVGDGCSFTSEVNGTCFDASGRLWTALSGTPGTIAILDREDKEVAHQYSTTAIARNASGSVIATGGQDSLAVVWDAIDISAMRSFPGATAGVSCVSLDSISEVMAWGCGGLGKDGDSQLYFGGVNTGVQYASMSTDSPVSRVAWHPKSSVLVYALAGDAGSLNMIKLS
jgi:WD40 repeat protein